MRTGAVRPPDVKFRLMDWPMASPPLKRSAAVVLPMTATRAFESTSDWVKNDPCAIVQFRTVSYSGVVPVTAVLVLAPPTMTWARPVSSGSIASASGTAPAA